MVTNLQVCIQSVPWVRSQLLQAKSNALLLVVEVQYNNIDLLVQLNNFLRIIYATPTEVCNVNKTVHATQVDEYTVRGDIFNGTLKYLTLLETTDDFLFLSLQLCFNESLVAYNNILVVLIDLDNLELHSFAYEDIVVTDGLNVNLRAGQEGLDAEYIDNHTTLSAALNVTLNNFFLLQSLIYTIPAAACACFLVRKN